jgi:predicted nucleic acid-binding protein
MRIVVNDANILMDIIDLKLTEKFFKINYEMYTTDFIINECSDKQKKSLNKFVKNKKLKIKTYGPDYYKKLMNIEKKYPQISTEDCSVFLLAREMNGILLTGDRKLRNIASENGLEVRGIFWVFDLLLDNKIITNKIFKDKLAELQEINKWLPVEEFEKRS